MDEHNAHAGTTVATAEQGICGNCGTALDEAWYSSSWGVVCTRCRDRERRTVVDLTAAEDLADVH